MKTLELRFKDDQGRTSMIGIPHPKEPIHPTEVSQVMDAIIATEAFGTHDSKFATKSSARVVERYVEPIDIIKE